MIASFSELKEKLIGSVFRLSSASENPDQEKGVDSQKQRIQGSTQQLRFKSGTACIPHDSKRHKGGEDAYTTSDKLIAVADGVGGWADMGVDPGLFSKQLCKDIQRIYDAQVDKKTLRHILVEAVKANKFQGSSTAVLASLEEPNVMKTANLGDSGYTIYRAEESDDGKISIKMNYRSEEQ